MAGNNIPVFYRDGNRKNTQLNWPKFLTINILTLFIFVQFRGEKQVHQPDYGPKNHPSLTLISSPFTRTGRAIRSTKKGITAT